MATSPETDVRVFHSSSTVPTLSLAWLAYVFHIVIRDRWLTSHSQNLGGFLSIYGAIVDGDGQGWSIGGVPRTGISGSHNNYETDSSPLKSDLSQYGSNQRLVMSQFQTVCRYSPHASQLRLT